MTVSRPDRSYLLGETVHLHVKVSRPGTKVPVDPNSVKLSSLMLGTSAVVVTTTIFTKENQGDYSLVIPTLGMALGTYDLTVTIESGLLAVVVLPDRFVLRPPTVN